VTVNLPAKTGIDLLLARVKSSACVTGTLAAGNTNPQGIADPPAPASAGSSLDYALLGILDELEGVLVGKKRK